MKGKYSKHSIKYVLTIEYLLFDCEIISGGILNMEIIVFWQQQQKYQTFLMFNQFPTQQCKKSEFPCYSLYS